MMKFFGVSKVFSTRNQQQYLHIGEFWDYFSGIWGRENILGLGYNWRTGSIEYVIGTLNQPLNFNLAEADAKFGGCVYKEIVLPDDGWQKFCGKTEKLAELYDQIYKSGALKYEIESFDDGGNCEVLIYR
ncbi:MAG: hypothetical protein MJ196_01555 [Treponemataceae bacterium]|nr:hypothetical protein [Treponemataceae bacterium]